MAAMLAIDTDEWMTMKDARLRLNKAASVIQRLALIGQIRTKIETGCPVRFNREDVERIAARSVRSAPAAG